MHPADSAGMIAFLRRCAWPVLALAALACPTFPCPAFAKAPPPPTPALWKVQRGPATIYLFGTIHLLPEGQGWRDPAIDAAIARARSLSLEIVVDRDPERIATAFTGLAFAKGLPPLAERVPADKRTALARMIAASGYPPAALDGMKSWAAAVVLTGPAMKQIGLAPGSGVEPQLTRLFRLAGKPVDELETPAQQLGYFDALPEAAQRGFLVQTLDDPDKTRDDFRAMLAAWNRGDVPGIARAFAEDPEFTPALRTLLLRRRDEAWADILAERLAHPGVSLVAVGAGHLVGPDSVQAMLARKGIRAVRVR